MQPDRSVKSNRPAESPILIATLAGTARIDDDTREQLVADAALTVPQRNDGHTENYYRTA